MRSLQDSSSFLAKITFFFLSTGLGVLLSCLPFPNNVLLRPLYSALIILYWALRTHSTRLRVLLAGLVGLLLDTLYGHLLGVHVLALSALSEGSSQFRHSFDEWGILKQFCWIWCLLSGYQAVLECLHFVCQLTTDFTWPHLLCPPFVSSCLGCFGLRFSKGGKD